MVIVVYVISSGSMDLEKKRNATVFSRFFLLRDELGKFINSFSNLVERFETMMIF